MCFTSLLLLFFSFENCLRNRVKYVGSNKHTCCCTQGGWTTYQCTLMKLRTNSWLADFCVYALMAFNDTEWYINTHITVTVPSLIHLRAQKGPIFAFFFLFDFSCHGRGGLINHGARRYENPRKEKRKEVRFLGRGGGALYGKKSSRGPFIERRR